MLLGPVDLGLKEFGVLNGPAALALVVVLNDVLFYPAHWLTHAKPFYPCCHRHRHRQFVPVRGYVDAAGQHPVEQMYGFAAFVASLHVVGWSVGLHAGAAATAVLAWAVLNALNHSGFDSKLHLPVPFPAFARDHDTHRRSPRRNVGTLTTLCDRLLGTYQPYKSPLEPPPEPPKELLWFQKTLDPAESVTKKAEQSPLSDARPALFPSHWSLTGTLGCMMLAAWSIEVCCQSRIPALHECFIFAKPAIVLFNVGIVCYGADGSLVPSAKGDEPDAGTRVYTKPRMQEAVAPGHHKQFVGGKHEYKTKVHNPLEPKAYRRDAPRKAEED